MVNLQSMHYQRPLNRMLMYKNHIYIIFLFFVKYFLLISFNLFHVDEVFVLFFVRLHYTVIAICRVFSPLNEKSIV